MPFPCSPSAGWTQNNNKAGWWWYSHKIKNLRLESLHQTKEGPSTVPQPGDIRQEIIYFLSRYRLSSVCYISLPYPWDSNAIFLKVPLCFHFPEFITKHSLYFSSYYKTYPPHLLNIFMCSINRQNLHIWIKINT